MNFKSLRLDEVNRVARLRIAASGKSINVARVLTTIGRQAMAGGVLGGRAGEFIRHDLSAAGIAHDFVETSGETRTCVTLIDESTGHATELVEESPAVDETAQLLAHLEKTLPGKTMLILSGSLAAGVPVTFYRDACRLANAAGVPVMVDARGEPLKLALAERPLVVKPNRAELAETMGLAVETAEELRAAMSAMRSSGPKMVVVTMGSEGAVADDGQQFYRIDAPAVKTVSAIGSGDAFAAGLASGLGEGKNLHDSLCVAGACAAANAMTAGAGFVDRETVQRLQVEIAGMRRF